MALLHTLTRLFLLIRFRAHMTAHVLAETTRTARRGLRFALHVHPIAGGAPDGDDDDDDGDGDDAAGDDGDGAPAGAGDDSGSDAGTDDTDKGSGGTDWRRMSRKHEREAKRARKERDEAAAKLKEREDADKSEQDKALEEARTSAKAELQEQHDKERRQDRLEAATARLAGKGLKVGDGDDAKTVRFADADDALLHLEREIRNGDLDPDEIFNKDGRVNTQALEEALTDLLARKPHLAAGSNSSSNGGGTKVAGSADGGKGAPAKTDSSVDDQFKQIRRTRTAA